MKKFTSLLIICTMLFASLTYAFAQENGAFDDVTSSHFAYDAVQYFYNENVINGVGNNKFAPDDYVTREQFAKMLSIIYNKENYEPKKQTFTDVTADMWSYKYIESLKEYLTGYYPEGGEAFFNPYGRATREDVAYALVKISGLKEKYSVDLSVLDSYSDSAEISVNLKEYVALAVSAGLMYGYEDLLRPQDGITRAEVATLLFRAIKRPVDSENVTQDKEDNKEDKENKEDEKAKPETEENKKSHEYEIETEEILNISGYTEDKIEGKVYFGWSPGDGTAEFEAELKCHNGPWEYVNCEIELCDVISVEEDEVTGYFDVKLNGQMRHDDIKGTITIKNNLLKLNTKEYGEEEYDYKFIVKTGKETDDEKIDDEKDEDKKVPEDIWDDSSYIRYTVKVDDKDVGRMDYIYKEKEGISKIDSEFKLDGKEYELELVDEISKADGELVAKFKVIEDGKVLKEEVQGRITGYNRGIGLDAELFLDDGSINAIMHIVEIAY